MSKVKSKNKPRNCFYRYWTYNIVTNTYTYILVGSLTGFVINRNNYLCIWLLFCQNFLDYILGQKMEQFKA